ncbi:MAG: hypothetical protein MUD01_28595, partial [Chloroflexaceae bacterium]|nr:hypothetical protein [Chloroflexaceae bacterium]
RHTANGQAVLVVTFCTGTPPVGTPFSPFAEETHRLWQLRPEDAVDARLHEDLVAMNLLSVDSVWVGLLDAIYRYPAAYYNNDTLFGPSAADDPLLAQAAEVLAALVRRFPSATFYAPLAVGFHVDHQALCQAALALVQQGVALAFYEDAPYVLTAGALDTRMASLSPTRFIPSVVNIDASLNRKLNAVEAYASQLASLLSGPVSVRAALTEYAEGLRPEIGTYGERVWLVQP